MGSVSSLFNDDASKCLDVLGLMISVYALASSINNAFKAKGMNMMNSSPLIVLSLTTLISFAGAAKGVNDVMEDFNV